MNQKFYNIRSIMEKQEEIERNKEKNKLKLYHKDDGLYIKYVALRTRCSSPKCSGYKHYGGRGIKNLWKTYKDFKHDMYDIYIEHLEKYGRKNTTIERIDNDGNYCKENCRFATWIEQRANQRK